MSSSPRPPIAGSSMKLNGYLIKSAITAALGGLLFGFDTAVIAGATHALTDVYQLTPALLGITVASALWGTVLGSIVASTPADRYGRRLSLMGMAGLYLVSGLGCAFAWSWASLVMFRVIGGLGIGGSSVVGPMYIAEIAPARWRGRLVALFQFNIVSGILLAYLSNYLVGLAGLGAAEWRWKLGVSAAPALLFGLMVLTIPESPRWLIKMRRVEKAKEILRETGEPDYENETRDIIESIDAEHGRTAEPLFQRKYRKPILLAISIGMFNQLAGVNAILYYLNDIFQFAGFSKISSDRQAVAIGATNFLFLLVAMSVIDRLGRRKLLLIGAAGTAACLAGVAAVFLSGQGQYLLLWLLVAFIGFFSFSQGAVIWVYLSEVFPTRVRAKGQSLGSFTHWFMNAIISGTFPMMAAASAGAPFAFFAAMTVLQFFVVLFFYPETKGISLEQMQKELGAS